MINCIFLVFKGKVIKKILGAPISVQLTQSTLFSMILRIMYALLSQNKLWNYRAETPLHTPPHTPPPHTHTLAKGIYLIFHMTSKLTPLVSVLIFFSSFFSVIYFCFV